MKEKPTGKASPKSAPKSAPKAIETDWSRLRARPGTEISRSIEADPNAVATDAEFWKKAKVVLPQPKQPITIRLDADLLAWWRRQKGYQTRINAVLRTYMDAHRS